VKETLEKIGEKVKLQGWVETRRDHGQLVFIELRDRSGKVQVVGGEEMGKLHHEDVIEILGTVAKRPEAMVNPNMETGTIEVRLGKLEILNSCGELPFPVHTDGLDIEEEVRLRFRYLDLRRGRLQHHLKLSSQFVQKCREYLFSQGFTEIGTPLLTQSTPEGSRDFLVPARLQPGKFFALPQSPQQYKQLLMTAGFERYFQIARCLRDEDLRADRAFEHNQIDIEMSFVTMEEMMALDEAMMIKAAESLGFKIKQKPFPRLSFQEALKTYGSDKFDMRSEAEKKQGILAFAWVVEFPFFEKTEEGNWTFTHNPFSMPKPEHLADHLAGKNIDKIITQQYDLVCNGYEVGGGSIRAHRPEILEATYKIMGYTSEQIQHSVGHMLKAFTLGTPPHGGIAHGIERLLMTLTGEGALREVVAFPQTARGTVAVMDAPSAVTEEQLKELGLAVRSYKQPNKEQGSVFDQIQNYLNEEVDSYLVMNHQPVFTSEESAKIRGTKIKQGAKALIMFADKKPVMLVLSAANKVDTAAFKKAYQIKDLRMATKEEVESLTKTQVGAVPPFGNLFKMPVYVDEKLGENEEIVFNAGLHTRSIKMKYRDFIRIVKPTVGAFAE
ncbi:hypothetical protein A2160_00355, partial [Candidatus Beckwithbacteria bacterium RBG_13_42_9]